MLEFANAKDAKTKTKAAQKRKTHKCTECDRAFVRKSHFDRHKRTHTGERNYACELCGARYKEKYNLNAHRLKHGASYHRCWLCHKVWVKNRNELIINCWLFRFRCSGFQIKLSWKSIWPIIKPNGLVGLNSNTIALFVRKHLIKGRSSISIVH